MARRAGKRCAVMLDHWVNYKHRFIRHGHWHWPDEIWVGDEEAAQIAAESLPEIPCLLVPNAYFLDLKDDIKNITVQKKPQKKFRGISILYVCEPLREASIALYGHDQFW